MPPNPPSSPATTPGVAAAALWAVVALGLVQLGWALFQWQQLVELRAGGEIFCGLRALGDCAAIWDSPFARGVRAWTGLPVAGWGVVWGLAATVLPAAVLGARRAGRPTPTLWSATVLTALAGVAGVAVLVAASAQLGAFCGNCVFTYVLVGAYAAVCVREALRQGPLRLGTGALGAAGAVAVGYLLALYPAARTPQPVTAGIALREVAPPAATPGAGAASGIDGRLAQLIAALPARSQQMLSNALEQFRKAPQLPMRPARGLIGPPDARVHLTEFADLLCSHCADLHQQLTLLLGALPQGTLRIEPRYFPLDGRCNPMLQPADGPPTRCLAAKAMICAAEHPRAFELSGRLFERQRSLTPEDVVTLASTYVPRPDLEACMSSPDTAAKLREDIEWAAAHGIQGTPLVLLDGRALPLNGPMIDALLLAGGDPDHPAFDALPPPQPTPG